MGIGTTLINRISEIIDGYDVVLLSYYGVLSDCKNSYPHSIETLERIKRAGKSVIILTNSSLKSHDLSEDLAKIGITNELYDGILSSGEIVYNEMEKKVSSFFASLGSCYYHIGRKERTNDWVDIGYIPVEQLENANFLIVTSSEKQYDSIEKYLPILKEAADIGLPLLCVSPDKNLGLSHSDDIGAGAIASRYEAVGGLSFYRGKPQKDVFEYCIEGFPEIDRKKFLMIANSYTFDIKGASEIGIDNVLIGKGTHARELGIALGKGLDLQIVDELSRHYGYFPNYVMLDFKY